MRWIAVPIGMGLGAIVGVWMLIRDLILHPTPRSKGEIGSDWDYLPQYLAGTALFAAIGAILGVVVAAIIGGKKRR